MLTAGRSSIISSRFSRRQSCSVFRLTAMFATDYSSFMQIVPRIDDRRVKHKLDPLQSNMTLDTEHEALDLVIRVC